MNRQGAKGAKGGGEDDTFDGVYMKWNVEIDAETEGKIEGFQVGHNLCGVDRCERNIAQFKFDCQRRFIDALETP